MAQTLFLLTLYAISGCYDDPHSWAPVNSMFLHALQRYTTRDQDFGMSGLLTAWGVCTCQELKDTSVENILAPMDIYFCVKYW